MNFEEMLHLEAYTGFGRQMQRQGLRARGPGFRLSRGVQISFGIEVCAWSSLKGYGAKPGLSRSRDDGLMKAAKSDVGKEDEWGCRKMLLQLGEIDIEFPARVLLFSTP